MVQEVPEPAVGLLGGREPGVLAHGPEAAPVHRGLDAAGERVLARPAEVTVLVETRRGRPACRGRGPRCPDDVSNRSRRSGAASAGLGPERLAPAVAARVAALPDRASAARSSGWLIRGPPGGRRAPRSRRHPAGTRVTVPALGARSSFCIFMASTASRVWPASTVSPGSDGHGRDPAGDDGTDLQRATSGSARGPVTRGTLAEGGPRLVLDQQLEAPALDDDLDSQAAVAIDGVQGPDHHVGPVRRPSVPDSTVTGSSPGWADAGASVTRQGSGARSRVSSRPAIGGRQAARVSPGRATAVFAQRRVRRGGRSARPDTRDERLVGDAPRRSGRLVRRASDRRASPSQRVADPVGRDLAGGEGGVAHQRAVEWQRRLDAGHRRLRRAPVASGRWRYARSGPTVMILAINGS